ncbi:MAG: response regulator [Thermodesulfobacteriota bacterium]
MEKIRVLVVDDEEDFLKSLVWRLGLREMKASGVTSGEEALAFLAENQVDVVVLDLKMPGMNGLRALREIRRLHPETEVIILTGHAAFDSENGTPPPGVFDYVIKPVRLEELIGKIKAAHEKVRADRERKKG